MKEMRYFYWKVPLFFGEPDNSGTFRLTCKRIKMVKAKTFRITILHFGID
jgi:hypothetical protein